jgi:hypothetical protein
MNATQIHLVEQSFKCSAWPPAAYRIVKGPPEEVRTP